MHLVVIPSLLFELNCVLILRENWCSSTDRSVLVIYLILPLLFGFEASNNELLPIPL